MGDASVLGFSSYANLMAPQRPSRACAGRGKRVKRQTLPFRVGIPLPKGTGQDAYTPLPQNTLRKKYYNTMFK